MIETNRLLIRPLSSDELIDYIQDPVTFAEKWSLSASCSLMEKETQEAVLHDLLPFLSDPMKDPLFYTMWVIIEKKAKAIIGGFCFHGEPDVHGEVEIGYGTDEAYRNKGYMSEMILGLVQWAPSNAKIRILKAETEKGNQASIRVLEKNGFVFCHQTDEMVTMKYSLK